MKNLNFLVLVGIIVLAIFLRLYAITSVPPSASLDEVSLGWNAYSIMQTGRDEFGEKFPRLLRAYDDWRPSLYVYLVTPFIKIFDLNVISVRLPSVILSILTVLATYFLVREFFKKENIAQISAFLLAISPWHIYMSRLGHEVNLGLACAIFAILFFVKKNIYLSAIFFVISAVSYQTEKIFIPVMLLGIFFIYRDELLRIKKKLIITVFLSILALTPFISASLSPSALIRFKATNVFQANELRFTEQVQLLHKAVLENDIFGQLFYNRRTLALQIFAEGYLSHFNPTWLFTNSSEDRHKVPGLGLLYVWTLPFIVIGIYILVRKNFDSEIKKLIFLWFLSAPLAASITTDAPHALRSLVFLPTWQIFASLGIVFALSVIKNKKYQKLFFGVSSAIVVLSLVYFLKQYFIVFPKNQSDSFQYALSKAVPYVLANQDSYERIVFSNKGELYQSYMFYLFYSKYSPERYLKEGGTKSGGFNETHQFSKLEFRPILWNEEKRDGKTLYVGESGDFPSSAIDIYTLYNLDKSLAIRIVK